MAVMDMRNGDVYYSCEECALLAQADKRELIRMCRRGDFPYFVKMSGFEGGERYWVGKQVHQWSWLAYGMTLPEAMARRLRGDDIPLLDGRFWKGRWLELRKTTEDRQETAENLADAMELEPMGKKVKRPPYLPRGKQIYREVVPNWLEHTAILERIRADMDARERR